MGRRAEKEKERKHQKKAYMLFTGAMIACCVALYLFQPQSTFSNQAEAEPTPTPLRHNYPDPEVFMENAGRFGLEAENSPQEAKLPLTLEYGLLRTELPDAHLTLSLKEGGVCAFLLRMPFVEDPGEQPENASAIEADVHQAARAAYLGEQTWRKEALEGLCAALDPLGTCTAADISRFYALLEETALKGAAKEEKSGKIAFSSYILYQAEGSFLCASASRRDE